MTEAGAWARSSTVDLVPPDPAGEAVAAAITEMVEGATVDILYGPAGATLPPTEDGAATASATAEVLPGWQTRLTVGLGGPIAPMVTPASAPLLEILRTLPAAGLRTAGQFAGLPATDGAALTPSMRRALRDSVVVEALTRHHACSGEQTTTSALLAETLEYLVELSGTRVEANDLTHGVVITDALADTPRLRFAYPRDLRAAKRAPLLFDGQQSVLVVDWHGRARTELQRHRLNRLRPEAVPRRSFSDQFTDSGALVAETTRQLGGIGFFLRADRTIWVFADGQPLLIRRRERWTAFPLELATAITKSIGGSAATARTLVEAALIISVQRHGAILAIVDQPDSLEGIVPPKDRYDLRNTFDPMAMGPETRLHHLIDAADLDGQTLARLASLDGATILDREGRLLTYGAIVTSSDSQHEGARTAAAKSLSHSADIVLKVSVDGDITVFRDGEAIATLLG